MTELEMERFKLYQEKVSILDAIDNIICDDNLCTEDKLERIVMEMQKH